MVMRTFTFIGSPGVMWPLACIALWLFWRAGWRYETTLLALSLAGALVLDTSLKLIFHRPRPAPFWDTATPDSYSYPSGHALFALCFFGALAWSTACHVRRPSVRVLICTGAALLAALIGFSRIYLGVHYPTDVIAGFGVAFLWMTLVATGAALRRRPS